MIKGKIRGNLEEWFFVVIRYLTAVKVVSKGFSGTLSICGEY
jgi:hypothetical protein